MPASARARRVAPEANSALHSVSSGAISGSTSQALRIRALRRGGGLRAAPGGEHGGGGAQRGQVGGRVALVRRLQHRRLVEAGAGLGEQVEGGGRRGGPAQDGVDVAGGAGQ